MHAVKGYLSNGRIATIDGAILPAHARVMIVIEEVIASPQPSKPSEDSWENIGKSIKEAKTEERLARKDWLNSLRQARELATGELLPDFPPRTLMGEPHGLTD